MRKWLRFAAVAPILTANSCRTPKCWNASDGWAHSNQLVFDDQAIADLENIFGWIAQDSPATARTVTDRLFSSIELLISFPLIGHVGRDPDTFEWVVPRLPYVVVYEVDREQERIVVTAVFHGAQDREGGNR